MRFQRVLRSVAIAACVAGGLVASVSISGCATYKEDLARGEKHYAENRFEHALALFRVMEPDIDSLSDADQAKYCYLRGMTDYRLSTLQSPGSTVKDPRKEFRANARHWLGVAAAMEKNAPSSLTGDERQRLDEAMNDLNRDVYGGAESMPDAPPTAAPTAPGMPPGPAAQPGWQQPPAQPTAPVRR